MKVLLVVGAVCPPLIRAERDHEHTQRRALLGNTMGVLAGGAMVEANAHQTVSCEKATFESLTFDFCQPPGALGSIFFQHGVEEAITRIFIGAVEEEKNLANVARARAHIVDVGLNEGWYTLVAAQLGASVTSYEVQPGCIDMVSRSVAMNAFQNVTIHNQGAWKQLGSIKVPRGTCSPYQQASQSNAQGAQLDVPLVTLESSLAAAQLPITLLKIDAEGSEGPILRGALRLVKEQKVKSIVLEFVPIFWKQLGVAIDEAKADLRDTITAGQFKAYILPNDFEQNGPGLAEAEDTFYNIGGFRKLIDLDAFVDDRLAKRMGCNMLLKKQ
jgi:FkbM family methyltransferase